MTDSLIIRELEFNGYSLTDNPYEAIYVMRNGNLISGDFDMGIRGTDHRMVECLVNTNRYKDDLWDVVHNNLGLVRLVPETKIALINEKQELTQVQKSFINDYDFEIEVY